MVNELIIDNFAGGGGASTGIKVALDRSKMWKFSMSRSRSGFGQIKCHRDCHYSDSLK